MTYLYLDPGSSGTKILTCADFCGSHFIQSGVEEINTLNEEDRQTESRIQYEYGVGIVEVGDKTYRVGDRPVTGLSQGMKYTGAIIKTIAAIASEDCGKGGNFDLGFVLPLDEYSSAKLLAQGLREALPKAKFNGEKVNAKISSIRITPEGAGLLPLTSGTHVSMMVGHTDISLVRFRNGRIDMSLSQTLSRVGLGAIAIALGIPGDDMELSLALSKGKLSMLEQPGLTLEVLQQVEEQRVSEFVLNQIVSRLNTHSWFGVESIVMGGGGARYLKPWVEKYLPIKPKLCSPNKGLKLFGGADRQRFADLYGIAYHQLRNEIDARIESDNVKSVEVEVLV